MVRNRPEELAAAVEMTPWAREEYYASYEGRDLDKLDPVEAARRFLVRRWQSHGSRIDTSTGWRMMLQAEKGPRTVPYRQWKNVPDRIRASAARLLSAQIENRPALEVIAAHRHPSVLVYASCTWIRPMYS